jgi:hypothetical protein
LDSLDLQFRGRCLRFLYTICGREVLLPQSLEVLPHYIQGVLMYRGGRWDVFRGQYQGREVAVKALRARDPWKIVNVGCPQHVACVGRLTMSCAEDLQGGCEMEFPPSSECVTVAGYGDGRDSLCDCIRVDGTWAHQRVCEVEH